MTETPVETPGTREVMGGGVAEKKRFRGGEDVWREPR